MENEHLYPVCHKTCGKLVLTLMNLWKVQFPQIMWNLIFHKIVIYLPYIATLFSIEFV